MDENVRGLLPLLRENRDVPGVAVLLDHLATTDDARATPSAMPAESMKRTYRIRAERGVSNAVAGDLQSLADQLDRLDDRDLVGGGVVYAGAYDAYLFTDEQRGAVLGCLVFPHWEQRAAR